MRRDDWRSPSSFRMDTSMKVDVAELTWEQRERVLRYLFARMNTGGQHQSAGHKATSGGNSVVKINTLVSLYIMSDDHRP